MEFFEKITGNDINKKLKCFEIRAKKLPPDYQNTWKLIKENLWQYSTFTGRNLTPIFDNALEILEELASSGKSSQDSLGNDIKGFCEALVGEECSNSFHHKCHKQLNDNIAKKIGNRVSK